jgi:hypothetical protein
LKALSLIRDQPWYRRQAFEKGLENAGFQITKDKADLVLIWNRYGHSHQVAEQYEREGKLVLVAENGYLGKGGVSPKFEVHPKGPSKDSYYSLSIGWHNGRGVWPRGEGRFKDLGVEIKPWRTKGEHILVCPNRSFGVGSQVMPPDWAEKVVKRLRNESKRPVVVRGHPGNNSPRRPLELDLKDAWAVVVWSSSVAVHSLLAGIPTFIEAPFHVLKGCGASGSPDEPVTKEREQHFERMAWHQWTCQELESGEPFRYLLQSAGKAKEPVGS